MERKLGRQDLLRLETKELTKFGLNYLACEGTQIDLTKNGSSLMGFK